MKTIVLNIIPVVVMTWLAAIFDLRLRRIPNQLVLMGYLWGLAYRIDCDGLKGSFIFGARVLWPICLLYILFLLRGIGAGDIKLFSVISAFLNGEDMITLIWLSFVIGAIYSLIIILKNRQLVIRLVMIKNFFIECASKKKICSYYTIPESSSFFPFSLCIGVGVIIMVFGEYMI